MIFALEYIFAEFLPRSALISVCLKLKFEPGCLLLTGILSFDSLAHTRIEIKKSKAVPLTGHGGP
jgi:hypothetical protein